MMRQLLCDGSLFAQWLAGNLRMLVNAEKLNEMRK